MIFLDETGLTEDDFANVLFLTRPLTPSSGETVPSGLYQPVHHRPVRHPVCSPGIQCPDHSTGITSCIPLISLTSPGWLAFLRQRQQRRCHPEDQQLDPRQLDFNGFCRPGRGRRPGSLLFPSAGLRLEGECRYLQYYYHQRQQVGQGVI